MPRLTSKKCPEAVTIRGGGPESYQRVHVGSTAFQLLPRPAIKLRPRHNLDNCRQPKRQLLKPSLHSESEHPFSHHQRDGAEDPDPKIPFPAKLAVLTMLVAISLCRGCHHY